MYFGGWNVRSCFHTYKQQLIVKQLSKYNIQVAALCETGIYDSGVKTVCDEWTMIYSGMPDQSKTRAAHGVAVCLNRIATTAWKNSGSKWEPVYERILRLRIHYSPINVTLISVYAPVTLSSKSTSDDSDKFYADRQVTVDQVQKVDMLLIIGDLNAHLEDQEHLTGPQCVGSFTTDAQKANGVKLLDFCMLNDVVVTNMFFQRKTIHQTSWMHPGKKSWDMLDYTIVNRKLRSSVEDVRSLRRATGAIETDPRLLRSKVKLHLKREKKRNSQRPQLRLGRSKLEDDDSIDVKYAKFVKHIKETAEVHFQIDQGSQRRREEWMTNEILEVIERKSLSYFTWQNHRGTPSESNARHKYVALRKLVKNMVDRRQTEYWDEISLEMETVIQQYDQQQRLQRSDDYVTARCIQCR